MRQLEKELWQPLKDSGLTVLIVGREHSLDEVAQLKSAMKLTMPTVADPNRVIYSKYAKKNIPRTFVIDKSGRIVLSEIGFSPDRFEQIKMVVAQLLGAKGTVASSSLVSPSAPASAVSEAQQTGELAMKSALYSIGKQQYDAAITDLEAFLKKWPQHAQAHYLLAICYSFKKNYEQACVEYNFAIKYATDSKLRSLAEMGLKKIGK